jgi:Uma2 family endonuclease
VLQAAPELCVEVLSESNSSREIDEKRAAYFAAGAHEVWIVDPQGETIAVFGANGPRERSAYDVDLTGLFAG